MYAEIAWVLVSSGTQVQAQIIPDPDYLPDNLSVSYDCGVNNTIVVQNINLVSLNCQINDKQPLIYCSVSTFIFC